MTYAVLKHTEMDGKTFSILINDPEGIPYEFETEESAQRTADLFQNNSTHGSKYEVVEIGKWGGNK